MVDVQLERVRAGVLDSARMGNPAAGGARVQAGDDRDLHLGLDPFEAREIAILGADEGLDRRKVVERLGELLGALLERAIEPDLLGQDLLLEQRRQDDRPHAGTFQPRGGGRFAVVRGGRGNDRRSELEPQVAGVQVDAHAPFPSLS